MAVSCDEWLGLIPRMYICGLFTLCIRIPHGGNFPDITFVEEAVLLLNASCMPGMAHSWVPYKQVL